MGDREGSDEQVLAGGNASGEVVRIGDTVRKPWTPTSARVAEYLAHLAERGVDVPRMHGRDEQGRLVLDFVPGELAHGHEPLDHDLLRRVGALVRQIHDASEGLEVPDDWPVLLPTHAPDLICHGDLAPWNLVVDPWGAPDARLVFIDFDGAGPSTRVWDLAYSVTAFAGLFAGEPVDAAAARLAAYMAGYQPSDELRAALPEVLPRRAWAMYAMLRDAHARGEQPWADMFDSFHGTHWKACADYLAEHRAAWEAALDR